MVDQEFDVVIIGAGAAGLSAALAAYEARASVTIIEKGDRLGGTAAISGGIVWVANNPQMQAAGMPDSAEEALAYFGSLNHGEMDGDVLAAFVNEGPEALSFLASVGALELSILPGYPDYYLDRPGAKPEGGRALDNDLFDFKLLGDWADKVFHGGDIHRLMLRETPLGGASVMPEMSEIQRRTQEDLRGFGQALVGRLLKACLDRGIEPMLSCHVQKLLTENGRIIGVEFDQGGNRNTVMARQIGRAHV